MNNISKQINEHAWSTDKDGKKWEDYDTILCPSGHIVDMQKLLDDQNRAKAALLHLQPFFSAFVGKLRPVYTFRIQTQATDGVNLFINPEFTDKLDLTEKVFVLAHEVMHCVLNHLRRGRSNGHNMQRSNIAADYECNITLSDAPNCMGLVKQSTIKKIGGYIDTKYNGWGYEKIYDDVKDSSDGSQDNSDQAKNAQNNQEGGQGGQGNQSQLSQDYVDGWNKAMEDYKKGKLKL